MEILFCRWLMASGAIGGDDIEPHVVPQVVATENSGHRATAAYRGSVASTPAGRV